MQKPEKQQQAAHQQIAPWHVDVCLAASLEHLIHTPSHTGSNKEAKIKFVIIINSNTR